MKWFDMRGGWDYKLKGNTASLVKEETIYKFTNLFLIHLTSQL